MTRVGGRTAAISGMVGLATLVAGVALGIAVNNILGFAIFLVGAGCVVVPGTWWLMTRYGVFDALEAYKRWVRSAPRRR